MRLPEFKYVQEEARYRLKIKRHLSKMGLKLDTNLKKNLTTEELLKLEDEIEKNGKTN